LPPAAGVPDGCAPWAEPVAFPPGDLPVLREAGARYLRGEPSVPVRITGEEAYRVAGHAHLVGLPVRVQGRLESRDGFRRLTEAAAVAPVQVDDAERDRLMKSLQEDLDFFGGARGGELGG
jgi:hypothetical protein